MFAEFLDLSRFRNRPVLTELAPEVASCRAERKDAGPRVKMIERFLFDRINAEPGALAVGRQDHFPADVFTNKAKTLVAILHRAGARAQVTNDPLVLSMPPLARIGVLILQDFQHGALIVKHSERPTGGFGRTIKLVPICTWSDRQYRLHRFYQTEFVLLLS